MTYITVYNLSINSNYRILAAELNFRFTIVLMERAVNFTSDEIPETTVGRLLQVINFTSPCRPWFSASAHTFG